MTIFLQQSGNQIPSSYSIYFDVISLQPVDWSSIDDNLSVDRSVGPVGWAKGGALHGYAMLVSFLIHRLKDFASSNYVADRDAQSHLSPWIRFGGWSVCKLTRVVESEDFLGFRLLTPTPAVLKN